MKEKFKEMKLSKDNGIDQTLYIGKNVNDHVYTDLKLIEEFQEELKS